MTSTERFKRSCVYAMFAVVVSTVLILFLVLLGSRANGQNSGTGFIDVAAYVLGFPLVLGWVVSTSIFC
jgi:hypothetical protein